MENSGVTPPDFLAIGHVTNDLSPDGNRFGGAVLYGAHTARKMGLVTAVVTSASADLDLDSALPGILVHSVPSRESTTFVNTYERGIRKQAIRGVASPVVPSDIPEPWRLCRLVMLGPVADEVSPRLVRHFPRATEMAVIQGWLRQWDHNGNVSRRRWSGTEVLPHVDAAVVSLDDIPDHRPTEAWKDLAPVLIVTMGQEGARVHFKGAWHDVEPFPTLEVDPTGAGDVFAAAYLIRYLETGDPLTSARFASCAASFCVEAPGTEGIPTRAQVEERLAARATTGPT